MHRSGTTRLRADVEAGKHYYAWVDMGEFVLTARLTPIQRSQSKNLKKWLKDIEWMQPDHEKIDHRVREREAIVLRYVQSVSADVRSGKSNAHQLDADQRL